MRRRWKLTWVDRIAVHKSQGQTLTRVKIDLQRTFEKGQSFWYLSDCRTVVADLRTWCIDQVKPMCTCRRLSICISATDSDLTPCLS
jgi:hypothetical protein